MNADKKKTIILLISITAAVICFILFIIYLFTVPASGDALNGSPQNKHPEYNIKNFKMPANIVQEFKNHTDDFSAYWIEYKLQNASNHTIADLGTISTKMYPNLWIDQYALNEEFPINLTAGDTFSGDILIIVKRANMNDSQLEQLIKGIGIGFDYYDLDSYTEDKKNSFLSYIISKSQTLYFAH